ncbi:SixA phosphatase family protein [Gaoshiqia sp. Z1-71]|uniref:SixA phosphatase family protein n=1 Tax=Gaoshiqia hydrogeniformans TaxID=3290090 RepID=UPI003BF8B7B8
MKRVVLVRHAKAVPYGYDDDFNRKLRSSGKDDAELLSSKLKDNKITPDLMISSPAKRAYKTAKIYAGVLRYPANKIRSEEELYEGMTTQDFIDMLREIPDEVQTVFVFGHNPTIYYLTNNLVRFFNSDMPTCSTVGIEFRIESWKELSARGGEMSFHLVPRAFR